MRTYGPGLVGHLKFATLLTLFSSIRKVMAIVVKRMSVEDYGEDRRMVLNEVQQLITNGDMQMQMIGKKS